MKKRDDGTTVYVTENQLDGRLSPINYNRRKGYNIHTMVQCPQCKKVIMAHKARAFFCYYKEPPGEEIKFGELPFCSYECILDWTPRKLMPKLDQ